MTSVPTNFDTTFTHHTAEVNGVRLHYVLGGKGKMVVLLHGWPRGGSTSVHIAGLFEVWPSSEKNTFNSHSSMREMWVEVAPRSQLVQLRLGKKDYSKRGASTALLMREFTPVNRTTSA